MNKEYTFESLNEWSSGDLIWLVLEMQEELKLLDKVFQNYLEYNDSDEEVRDLYLEIKNKN